MHSAAEADVNGPRTRAARGHRIVGLPIPPRNPAEPVLTVETRYAVDTLGSPSDVSRGSAGRYCWLMEEERELRVASDSFLTRIERLHALEEQKRELAAADTADLAREVETLTREVLEWAKRQTELAEAVAARRSDAGPISTTPPRSLSVVLAEWREAERRLANERPVTAGWESARADVDRLRDEYARACHAEISR